MRVIMRSNVGGPDYSVLETGEAYDLPDGFARALIHQGRAVLEDGGTLEDPGVVTMNGDALVAPENRAAKAPRKR